MREEELKKYWAAYTDAWKLMKNYKQVTEQHISQMMRIHSNTVFNRLFCLVVWQEIKRIRAGGTPLELKQYQKAFDDAWHLFKKFSSPSDTETYWEGVIDGMRQIRTLFNNNDFITNLLLHVTFEELERLWKISI